MTCALKHVGGTVLRYQHEDAWAEVMFNEWGADGLKVDHMCQGVNCGTGQQGHMMAVEYACVQCYPPSYCTADRQHAELPQSADNV